MYFPGARRPGRGLEHPPTPSAEVKEIVEIYLYSPSGHSRPVLRIKFTFLLYSCADLLPCSWLHSFNAVDVVDNARGGIPRLCTGAAYYCEPRLCWSHLVPFKSAQLIEVANLWKPLNIMRVKLCTVMCAT